MVGLFENSYELIENKNNSFDKEMFLEKVTDFFKDFDYIVGDFSYQKLRLKGFYNDDNKEVKSYNNYSNLEEYLKEECSYQCDYFILKKINNSN